MRDYRVTQATHQTLSDTQLTAEQINLLSRGLKFIPTPLTNDQFLFNDLLNVTDETQQLHEPTVMNLCIPFEHTLKNW